MFPAASGSSASHTTGADMCSCGSARHAQGTTIAHRDPGSSRSRSTPSSASPSTNRNECGFQTRSPNSALQGDSAINIAANAAPASPNGRRNPSQNIQTVAALSSSKNTFPTSGTLVTRRGTAVIQL